MKMKELASASGIAKITSIGKAILWKFSGRQRQS